MNYKLAAEVALCKYFITEVYPTGFCSLVSDSYDFWSLVTVGLPLLKDEIMQRDGKVVIRPDSGDPVRIICGYTISDTTPFDTIEDLEECASNFPQITYNCDVFRLADGTYYSLDEKKVLQECEVKGLVECLWDTFDGTVNEKGFKVLDEHIGAIYGDSITLERQKQILERLKDKGFASSNIVLGVGSYTYQHVTRDTHGMAIKATWCQIEGKGVEIFKDPKTDDGIKKSAKGLLQVVETGGRISLHDQVTPKQSRTGMLKLVFKDGKIQRETTLAEVRARVAKNEY